MGHSVTIFEEKKQLGGMLRYGIPAYRFRVKSLTRRSSPFCPPALRYIPA